MELVNPNSADYGLPEVYASRIDAMDPAQEHYIRACRRKLQKRACELGKTRKAERLTPFPTKTSARSAIA